MAATAIAVFFIPMFYYLFEIISSKLSKNKTANQASQTTAKSPNRKKGR